MTPSKVATPDPSVTQDSGLRTQDSGRPVLRPNPARLASGFQRLAEIGGEASNGVSRLPFSPEERRAHQLMGEW
ncbi:MAG: hypothetical protein HY690_04900, partial [Chloroflexi bacterium]|nr:hypothetical protein [Chloroflexota bacterium]